jgi:peptidyl-prolyl cis-trans isomerase SurA
MKRSIVWLIPALLILSWPVAAKVVDRIVAQVNDDIITLSDLNREMAAVRQELTTKYSGDQLEDAVKKAEKDMLEQLIEQRLLMQKAVELGFSANADVQVSAAIERIRKENNIKDTQEFERALAQQGMTLPAFREQIKRQVITQSLIQEMVSSRITLLSQEIEKYYKDHADLFSTPEEVGLSEIFIPIEGNSSAAEARANDIHNRMKQGESFSTLVSQYSKGPTAAKGGSIGSYLTSKLNPETAKAIANVKEGDFSAVVPGKDSYSIYRVDTRKVAAVKPLDQVRDEIKNQIWEQKFNPELKRFVAQLKEDAYIQIFTEIK